MSETGSKLESLLSGLLTVSAIVIACILVKREFFPSAANAQPTTAGRVVLQRDWAAAESVGVAVGDKTAPVTIVVFEDFECPACRGFNRTLREIQAELKDTVRTIFVHFPLPQHRFAPSAAKVAECGSRQVGFERLVDVLFAKQDSFGLRPWSAYVRDAGLVDTIAFAQCYSADSMPRIDQGKKLGERFEVQFTPTVIIGGWRFPDLPSKDVILHVARKVAAKQVAFDSAGNSID